MSIRNDAPPDERAHVLTRMLPMVCRFCGLATDTDLGHTTEAECIEALEREVARLRAEVKVTGSHRANRASALSPPGSQPESPLSST
jgi:hypothetical protein